MVRVLSAAAIGLCGYLLSMRLTGRIDSLAGCGDGGCSQLLGGRWSQWLGIPVTALAAAVYGGILLLTLPAVQRSPGRTGDQLLAAGGMVLAMAALWFLGVMAFADHGAANESRWCGWCLTLHGIGIAVAVILLADARRTSAGGGGRLLEAGGLTGVTGIAVLILGQLFATPPATHRITSGTIPGAPGSATSAHPAATPPHGARTLTFFQSSSEPLTFEVGRDPHLGPADARHVLVEYFDYTCRSCRDLYGDLQALKKKWPGLFTVIAVPSPLHRACNPWLSPNINNHAGACELAQMALAMWKAAPQHFPEYHDYLMRLPLPPNLPEARAKGTGLAGVWRSRPPLRTRR